MGALPDIEMLLQTTIYFFGPNLTDCPTGVHAQNVLHDYLAPDKCFHTYSSFYIEIHYKYYDVAHWILKISM